jgi:predicted HicB family RNase H-like nuclease
MEQMKQAKPKRGRPATTQGFPSVKLRLPPELHKKILAAAEKDFTSLNSQIIRRLMYSFGQLDKLEN